ncbi:MAG: hypothetical protein J1E85_00015 [Ruminococcus sp.]|nr:hypothetical protein [Ruminococcus sp.]
MIEINPNLQLKNEFGIYYRKGKTQIHIKDNLSGFSLPVGEILFGVLENVAILKSAFQCKSDLIIKKAFKYYKYNLYSIIKKFELNVTELERLQRLKYYLDLCCINPAYCTVSQLENFTVKLFEYNNPTLNLFSVTTITKIRKIQINDKKTKLYFSDTSNLINYLDSKYSIYSFSTQNSFSSLSELCIISLFEIFSLHLTIKKCSSCNNYFVSINNNKLCNRAFLDNDYLGCFVLKQKSTSDNTITKKKMLIYQRLYKRSLTNKTEHINIFDKFKDGWKVVSNKSNEEKMKFLNLDDWK